MLDFAGPLADATAKWITRDYSFGRTLIGTGQITSGRIKVLDPDPEKAVALAGKRRRRVAVFRSNGRLSQKITHSLETRTHGGGFFRAPKPSPINFPLQVQWIDSGHWIHRSWDKPSVTRL